jgi:hypothetical protein
MLISKISMQTIRKTQARNRGTILLVPSNPSATSARVAMSLDNTFSAGKGSKTNRPVRRSRSSKGIVQSLVQISSCNVNIVYSIHTYVLEPKPSHLSDICLKLLWTHTTINFMWETIQPQTILKSYVRKWPHTLEFLNLQLWYPILMIHWWYIQLFDYTSIKSFNRSITH